MKRNSNTGSCVQAAVARHACLKGVVLLAAAFCIRAPAQSIDHGALEGVFGESVTTSVTGSPQRVSEVPATMVIVTAEDIRRSGARDIPGVLRHVVGIDVQQWGNDSADVSARGYNQALSSRLLVLIDGRQVFADFYGYTPWATLPVELAGIRQIEIVKGPNSALFGFNAVGGVINIITSNPHFDDTSSVSLTGGTQDLVQASVVAMARVSDSASLRIMMGGNANDDFSTPQRPIDAGSRRGNERREINLQGVFQLGSKTELNIEATHSESEQPIEVPTYFMVNEQFKIQTLQGVVTSDTSLGLVQARLYGSSLGVRGDLTNSGNELFLFDNHVVVAQLQDIFKGGIAHVFRVAVEYRRSDVNTSPIGEARVSTEILSSSGMWTWKIAPSLSLTNAIRVDRLSLAREGYLPPGFGLSNADWNDRTITEPSFNSGLVIDAGDAGIVRITVARGIEMPSLTMFGAVLQQIAPGIPLYANGNPFIEPAVVLNYELSWDHTLPSLEASFRMSAFYQTTSDIASVAGGGPLSPLLVATSVNVGDSETAGVELSIKGTLRDSWLWGLSYSRQVVNDHRIPGLSIETTAVDFEHTTPKHVILGNLGWAHGPWEIDGYGRYQSAVQGLEGTGANGRDALVPIAGYASFDARVAYRLSEAITASVSGQNLLHDEQRQTTAAFIERRVFATLSIDF
jgi:outer membrane receptor for ferrienterochelin and colicins